ncbi:cysteine hydrolase family protein [Methanocella arvoryzae]|uniref:Isochorismatase n=1 Tax=Methanocella arvoryzae (strain DSM 22066 / NBRC 105507 / MRE50) TaxID=351160 RepID=Q0W799_METAR|nr:isochorismatase [uncultured archaeon]CAJ35744.1 isochorismatase [Methanocella arvoryzae MRE50]
MRTALLLIDIQNDYFPGGKSELTGAVEASMNARRLLDAFRLNKQPVIHVQHMSTRPGASFFIPGTAGSEIHDNVKPAAGEITIVKHYPNSFRETTLLDKLKQLEIEQLVVCGMMTHMCVDSTVRAAYDYGFKCILASDACATKDLQFKDQIVDAIDVHNAFVSALSGMFAVVKCTDELL